MEVDDQIKQYVEEMRRHGQTDDIIRQQLTKSGLPADKINKAMSFQIGNVTVADKSKSRNKYFITLAILSTVVLLALLGAVAFFVLKPSSTDGTQEVSEEGVIARGVDLQDAVNGYCVVLGQSYGFEDINTGYIASEQFSEEVINDSPSVIPLKIVGEAAVATIDCNRGVQPMGALNDLLFVKAGDQWNVVGAVQNNVNEGFECSVVEKRAISNDLINECSDTAGSSARPR